MSTSNSDKYKKKGKREKLSEQEFYRDLEAGQYPDNYPKDKILKSLTGD